MKFACRIGALACAFAFVALGLWAQADGAVAASPPLTKEAMLRGTIQGAIVRQYQGMAEAFRRLESECVAFVEKPTADSLSRARASWRDAIFAWERARIVPAGPLTDRGHVATIHFWPVRPASIQKALSSPQPLDAERFAELGAAATGLGVIEYLLFDVSDGDTKVLASFVEGEPGRRRAYLTLLARDLVEKAEVVAKDWTEGADAFGARFAAGGQDSLNLLINHLVVSFERPVDGRLRSTVALHSTNMLEPDLIEGAPSGVSRDSLVAVVNACREIYRGGEQRGIAAYVLERDAALHARIEAQFDTCLAALEAIGEPLEVAVTKDKRLLTLCYEHCKALELLLKVDLVSLLGVSLTFSANDGD